MSGRAAIRVESLAARLAPAVWEAGIEDLIGASFIRNRIRLRLPEADFTVRVAADPSGPGVRLALEAVFREAGQAHTAGGTWWDAWELTAEGPRAAGEALVAEVRAARRRFAVLLSDACGGAGAAQSAA